MKHFKKMTLLLAIPLIVVGCASAPQKKSYQLTTDTTQVVQSNKALPSLMVSQVKSTGRLSTDMTYSRSANEIESYTQSEWVTPPPQMIQASITQDLEARGLFQYVISAPNSIAAANRLDITVLEMNQIFTDNKANHIVLKIQARLVNNSTNKIIKTFTYNVTENGDAYNAEAGVAAYNRALNQIANNLANDLTQVLSNNR